MNPTQIAQLIALLAAYKSGTDEAHDTDVLIAYLDGALAGIYPLQTLMGASAPLPTTTGMASAGRVSTN